MKLGPFKKQNTWEFQVSDQVLEKLPPYMPTLFSFFKSHRPFPMLKHKQKNPYRLVSILKLIRGRTVITCLVQR